MPSSINRDRPSIHPAADVIAAAHPAAPAKRRAEDHALFEEFARTRSPAVRAALVERFLPLARHLAWRYHSAEDIEDLEQIAAIGLLKAIDRFDPGRGLAFSSFAFPTVTGELKRHLRDKGWSVRVPRGVQELSARLEKLSRELSARLGRSATVGELAQAAGCSAEDVLEARQAVTARRAVSLDQPPHEDDDPGTLGDRIAVEDPGFAGTEDAIFLEDLMRVLPPRERTVVVLRFRDDLLQSQIAELIGVSQMQVSRILRNAIDCLQETAAADARSRLDRVSTITEAGQGIEIR
jgi:RNA polymerase sigma-B factor